MPTDTMTNGTKRQDVRDPTDGPSQRAYDNATLQDTLQGKVNKITAPIDVADAAERKALSGTEVGVTKVIQADLVGILWVLVAADATLDASWLGVPYTTDPDGDVVINMELANFSGIEPDHNVLGRLGDVPSLGGISGIGGRQMRLDNFKVGEIFCIPYLSSSRPRITIIQTLGDGVTIPSTTTWDTLQNIANGAGATYLPIVPFVLTTRDGVQYGIDQITEIALTDLRYISMGAWLTSALTDLYINNSGLENFNLEGTGNIVTLNLSSCSLPKDVVVANNPLTERLVLSNINEGMESLTVSGATITTAVDIFAAFNLTNNLNLTSLDVSASSIQAFTIGSNVQLATLNLGVQPTCDYFDMYSCDQVTSLDFTGWTGVGRYSINACPALTTVTFEGSAAAGTALNAGYGGYYGGILLTNCGMQAADINTMFGTLPTVPGSTDIDVSGNPGAATCDTSIATAKGWNVIT